MSQTSLVKEKVKEVLVRSHSYQQRIALQNLEALELARPRMLKQCAVEVLNKHVALYFERLC